MMVIRRTVGQAIYIDDDIRIVITEIEPGGRVHIGIDAPTSISVHRQEIYRRIQQENCSASKGDVMQWLKAMADE